MFMKKILLTFFGLFLFSFNAYSAEKVINENITFKPFKCDIFIDDFFARISIKTK